jgi:hypothetical protein
MNPMKVILVTIFTLLFTTSLPLTAASITNGSLTAGGPTGTNLVDKVADAAANSASGGSAATVIAVIAMLLALGALGLGLYSRFRPRSATPDQPASDELLRSRLAVYLTSGAMLFIGAMACLVLLCAGLNAVLSPNNMQKTTLFFDIVKYLLTAMLPVVAGWVGTVLAFYYGKANFEAATKSVKEMAAAMTSKDKLAATPVRVLGKTKTEITFLPLTTTDANVAKTIKLDAIQDAFMDKKKNVTYERLPVLFSNDVPYLVLHRSVLTDFLLKQKSATPAKDAKDCTLADLFAAEAWLAEKSFVTVDPNATAAQAREKMEPCKECTDVIVTTDGNAQSAMVRWVTNVDLLKAAEV